MCSPRIEVGTVFDFNIRAWFRACVPSSWCLWNGDILARATRESSGLAVRMSGASGSSRLTDRQVHACRPYACMCMSSCRAIIPATCRDGPRDGMLWSGDVGIDVLIPVVLGAAGPCTRWIRKTRSIRDCASKTGRFSGGRVGSCPAREALRVWLECRFLWVDLIGRVGRARWAWSFEGAVGF